MATTRRGQPLSPEEIFTAALRLIETDGVAGLSMRKLATELDVNPMSVYHHVPNKTALLEGVCLMVGRQITLPQDDDTPWPKQLRALAHAYRSLARISPSLWSYAQLHPEVAFKEEGLWNAYTRILLAAGLRDDRLIHIRKALFAFVSGFISAEASGALTSHGGVSDPDETFEAAIDFIIAGLSPTRD